MTSPTGHLPRSGRSMSLGEAGSLRAGDPQIRAIQRRTLAVVVASQVLGGAGLAAGVTVGGLLAQDMLGSQSVAGLPSGTFTLGSAVAAFFVGRYSQLAGRRHGLAAGFIAGAIGASGIVLAAALDSPILLFASLFVYGAGTATNLQARYAGTDLATRAHRATAASTAMVATTFGAVAGPNLVDALGHLAEGWGIPRLAGPFMLAAVAYAAAGLVLFTFLRPDPLHIARALAPEIDPTLERPTALGDSGPVEDLATPAEHHEQRASRIHRGVVLGASVMILTQFLMTGLMTMTPVHMRAHMASLELVGLVISLHIAAMYFPSLVTGRLVDRIGRVTMAVAAAFLMLAAGLVAAIAPSSSDTTITVALVLLGLGWNLGLISGTALIVDSTDVKTRASTQGSVDVLIALAGACGGALSGFVVDLTSYSAFALTGALLALGLLPIVAWYASHHRPIAAT